MRSEDWLTALFQKFLDGRCTDAEVALLMRHFNRESKHTPLRLLVREQLSKQTPADEGLQRRTDKVLAAVDDAMAMLKASQIDNLSTVTATPSRRYQRWLSVAAALIIGVLVWGYYAGTFSSGAPAEELYVSTLQGENKQFTLADGTRIWLNAGSKLTYPEMFGPTTRSVRLEGEAFFEVSADAQRPFVVALQDSLTITVLGTSFNAKSYEGENTAKVSVSTGKVKVATATETRLLSLEPGEEGVWRQADRNLSKRKVDLENIALWRSNRLRFDEEPFSDVIMTLQRKYDIHFEVKRKQLFEERTTLTIGDEPLGQVLIPLSFSHDFKYYFANDSTVVIQ